MIITHNDFDQMLTKLYEQLATDYDLIIGMQRGGLIPAVHISHKLGKPFAVADISHPDSVGDNKFEHGHVVPKLGPNIKKVLVVDDIMDSGHSISHLLNELPTDIQIDVAVLVFKEGAKLKPNRIRYTTATPVMFATKIPSDSPFIYFHWETQPVVKQEA